VCGFKSETINLDRRVDLRCGWTSFLSEEILSFILRVSLEYSRGVLGYDISTRYRLDSLSIQGWLDILYWICLWRVEKVTVILFCNWLYIIQHWWLREYPEFYRNSRIQCAWNWQGRKNWNQTWKYRRTWTHRSRLQISESHFHIDNIGRRWGVTAARQILTQRNIRHHGISLTPTFTWRTCFSSHIGSSKWGYDSVYQCHHLIFITIII